MPGRAWSTWEAQMTKPINYNRPSRLRALAVLSRMRKDRVSLSAAARLERTTLRNVRKQVGTTLRRDSSSKRYAAKPGDTFRRDLSIFSPDGYRQIVVRSSKQAQLASQHLNAIQQYLRNGNPDLLLPFRGKRIGGIELLIYPARIREFAEADLVRMDALYSQNRSGGSEA